MHCLRSALKKGVLLPVDPFWQSMTKIARAVKFADGGRRQSEIFSVLSLMLLSCDKSKTTFEEAFRGLWPLWTPCSSWEAADSFLELTCSALGHFVILGTDCDSVSSLNNLVSTSLASKQMFLRATAFRLLLAMNKSKIPCDNETSYRKHLLHALSEETEAVV